MDPIVVDMGKQLDGYTFRLNPLSQIWLNQHFPDAQPVSSVFISFDSKEKMRDLQTLMWPQILTLLTGFPELSQKHLNHFSIISPTTGQELYSSRSNHVQ